MLASGAVGEAAKGALGEFFVVGEQAADEVTELD
jgi:hypothetical protein